MEKLFKRLSAFTMAVTVMAINLTFGCFGAITSAELDSPAIDVTAMSSGQPFITKVKIKSENSLLRFLHSGIFGKEKVSVTVYAKDSNGNPISDINLFNADNTEIESTDLPAYDAENDAYFITWNLEKGSYSLSAQPCTEQAVGGFYSIDLSKSNNDEVNEKEYQAVDVNSTSDGRLLLIEDTKPGVQIFPVHTDSNGNYVNLDSADKYSDGGFYSCRDNGKVWTNGAFEYLANASDDSSGIYSISYKLNNSSDYTVFKTSVEEIQQEFSLPISVPTDIAGEKSVSVRTEDNAGNISDSISSVPVEIDRTAPSLVIEKAEIISENGSAIGNYSENNWVNKRVRITVSAEDGGAGVDRIECSSVGKVVLNNVTRSGRKVTNVYIVEPDFMGNIVFSAYDKVNNRSKDVSYKVRSETTPPSVTNFDINQDITIQDYGFSLDSGAVISIEAYDVEPYWSGINYIELGFVDLQSMSAEFNYSEDSIVKSEPVYVSQDSSVQSYNFSVGSGFKGQILARAVDVAGNVGKWRTLESLVTDSQEIHDESSYRGIIIDEAQNTDSDGNPLYSTDQKIRLNVKDSHAGIKEIKWYVRTSQGIIAGSDTNSDFTANNTDGWTVRKKRDIITEAEKEITVAEDENSIEIGLCFSDNAGFETPWEVKYISIDKTKPEIVSFSFNDDSKSTIFNKSRTATVIVRERNIAEIKPEITVANQLNKKAVPYTVSDWVLVGAKSNRDAEDENLYKMTINFTADADYKLNMNVSDITGKTADNSVKADFTIDRTAPDIKISYDNNTAVNKSYYNADRKATITITERNFKSDGVKYTLTAFAEDNVTKIKETQIIPDKLKWTQNPNNKDEWTAQVNFNKEGKFSLSVSCTDKAGNRKTNGGEFFYIDKTAPKVEQSFTNGSEKSATNQLIVPKVKVSDYNLGSEKQIADKCQVIVNKIDMDGNTDKNLDYTAESYTSGSAKKSAVYELTYNIFAERSTSDGIYNISIYVSDLAGNTTEIENLNLSINRNGSTFELINTEAKEAVEKYATNKTPLQEGVDVEIKEINVSKRVGDSVITVTRDNKKARILTEDDYTIEEGKTGENDNGWFETTYRINKSNFADDGVYVITIETNDEVGNTNINKKSTVQFSVDGTAPQIVISGVRDNANLKESEVQLRITFSDRNLYNIADMHGDDMIIKINNDVYNFDDLGKLDVQLSNDEAGSIVMLMNVKADGKNSKNDISASLRDRADNASEFRDSAVTFRLSSTFLMRHGWIAVAVIALVLLILGIDVFFIAKKIKRR
ncbi:MAG: hypothetical protein NC489_03240 [Ruminococcus flavefaciens]|nr:hypothetical protein [Ruminococcus flavefaciens]